MARATEKVTEIKTHDIVCQHIPFQEKTQEVPVSCISSGAVTGIFRVN